MPKGLVTSVLFSVFGASIHRCVVPEDGSMHAHMINAFDVGPAYLAPAHLSLLSQSKSKYTLPK